jgi:hypothetical protein
MLCQNHEKIIKGFMGQTTAFVKKNIKTNVLVMGENKAAGEARYIHGEYGKGTWTFYGGHDPEDYEHKVGDPPTDLALTSKFSWLSLDSEQHTVSSSQKEKAENLMRSLLLDRNMG